LRADGHEAIVIARSAGSDLVTGDGLDAALAGVDAVIDATNTTSSGKRGSSQFFEATARTLMRSADALGIRHLVVLSIIGLDRVPYGYYQGKLRQEQVLPESPVPVSILRAAQFHEFAGQYPAAMLGPLVLVPRWRAQPVSAREATGDLGALIRVLDPDVVLVSDGGGLVRSARKPVLAADRVARFPLGMSCDLSRSRTDRVPSCCDLGAAWRRDRHRHQLPGVFLIHTVLYG
jgi:hypothetical protein